ncbi:MAG: FAD-dependent oxidoreductase [Mailhella sp.]
MPPVFSREDALLYVQNAAHAGQPHTSPCETHCLAGNAIQKMEKAIADGNFNTALQILRARNPFPGITGRVCPHPCEKACNRSHYDECVSIRSLERFAADNGTASDAIPLPSTGKKIAIIGSGPSGLSCAYFSALMGHEVTVFEGSPVAGGVPRLSIPDFRLPKMIVDREVGLVLEKGVSILTNTKIGRDASLEEIRRRFDAVVLAVGNAKERRLTIPGMEKADTAVDFLIRSNMKRDSLEGKNVVVLGGGGVAFDAAFTARRLGAASVSLVFIEKRNAMRTPEEEVRQAEEEGLILYSSSLAAEVEVQEGKITGLFADKLTGFRFLENGTLEAQREENGRFHLEADMVICASGLMVDLDFLEGTNVTRSARGFITVDENGMSSEDGLFATGECATGPSLVGSAVADGRKTAFGIDAWFKGEKSGAARDVWINESGCMAMKSAIPSAQYEVAFEDIINIDHHEKTPCRHCTQHSAKETWLAFEELEEGLSAEEAQAQAERCLHCGHCQNCGECVASCAGLILEKTDDGPKVVYTDECWHCGCCRLACPGGCISFKFPLHTML